MWHFFKIYVKFCQISNDDDDEEDDDGRARDHLSGAVTLADICLEKLPWENKCGIIQPTTLF